MWIITTRNKADVHIEAPLFCSYISRQNAEKYYFDNSVFDALEKDGFLEEMWHKFDAMFDFGDCDFFLPDKCIKLKTWLEARLKKEANDVVRPVYEKLLEYTDTAIKYDTGVSFDF